MHSHNVSLGEQPLQTLQGVLVMGITKRGYHNPIVGDVEIRVGRRQTIPFSTGSRALHGLNAFAVCFGPM